MYSYILDNRYIINIYSLYILHIYCYIYFLYWYQLPAVIVKSNYKYNYNFNYDYNYDYYYYCYLKILYISNFNYLQETLTLPESGHSVFCRLHEMNALSEGVQISSTIDDIINIGIGHLVISIYYSLCILYYIE